MKKTYIEIIQKNKRTVIEEVKHRNYCPVNSTLCFRYYDKNRLDEKTNQTKWIYNAEVIDVGEIDINLLTEHLRSYVLSNNISKLYKIDKNYYKIPRNSITYDEYSTFIEYKKEQRVKKIFKRIMNNENKNLSVIYNLNGEVYSISGILTYVDEYHSITIDTHSIPFLEDNIQIIEIKNNLNQTIYKNDSYTLPVEEQRLLILGKNIIEKEKLEEEKTRKDYDNFMNNLSKLDKFRLELIKDILVNYHGKEQKEFLRLVNSLDDINKLEEVKIKIKK